MTTNARATPKQVRELSLDGYCIGRYNSPVATGKFADRVRAAREARGMTQEQASASIGVHRVTLAKWETGAQAPTGLIAKIAEAWIAASARKGGRRGS